MKLALNAAISLASICFLALVGLLGCGLAPFWAPDPCDMVRVQVGVSNALRNAALLIVAILATLTWVIGQLLSHLRARQQHTISLIVMRLTNDTLVEDIDAVEAAIPRGTVIDEGDAVRYATGRLDAIDPDRLAILQAVKRIANFYEFLAEAYVRRTVDRAVLRSTLEGSFIEFYRRVWPYIVAAQGRLDVERLQAAPERPAANATFARYHEVMARWGAPISDIARRPE